MYNWYELILDQPPQPNPTHPNSSPRRQRCKLANVRWCQAVAERGGVKSVLPLVPVKQGWVGLVCVCVFSYVCVC